jgi:hypothetical protein
MRISIPSWCRWWALTKRMRPRRLLALLITGAAFAQVPPPRLQPEIEKMVASISAERITASLRKLEGFGTRHAESPDDHPTRGIGAARRWIFDQFRTASPRLEVSYDSFDQFKTGLLTRDTQLHNVVAVLPGTINKDRYILVTAHYDSMALVRKAGAAPDDDSATDWEATAATPLAPGVNDDGSGTAAVLELARVLSRHEFEKTLVFIAFTAEEQGLLGSKHYAAQAKQRGLSIEAVLNNDMIGSDLAGNGRRAGVSLRVFSEGPEDSPSRSLARYVKQIAERYVPSMRADLIFRQDRFTRGGDHMPFNTEGYPAVRLTTPAENYAHQHSPTDTFAYVSVPYLTRVVRMNAAVAASLALAPKGPDVMLGYGSRAAPNLSRGKSQYDAALRWNQPDPEPDLAGYAIMLRSTRSPLWEREIYVGNVLEYTIPNLSVDEVIIGVKAIDKQGNQSPVSAYVVSPGLF